MRGNTGRIAVVGAGIVGASIAYHLAKRGARVTLIDAGRPGGGVTARAFGWINVSSGVAGQCAPLRGLAIADYHRLDAELGGALGIHWCGALTWSADPAEAERMVRDHAARGHDIRLLDRAAVTRLEPGLVDVPECAAHAVGEGSLDAAVAAATLAAAARAAGAETRTGTQVRHLEHRSGRVVGVSTDAGSIAADLVVIAAGTGAPAVCRTIGVAVPIHRSPAIRLRFRAPGPLVNGIVQGTAFEVRQPAAGTLLAAEDYINDTAEDGPKAVAGRALTSIRAGLLGGGGLTLAETVVGVRAIPADGDPIIGRTPGIDGIYLAVMHAGVTLAPTVGRLAAAEILGGGGEPALDHCRPDRFTG
ncbi:MAG: FAD-binding oxidoreductase [Thalassobaculum sp.]|uniref:NAD(P)/FAD-dependent oxidoreductase n=1 Tax=Thalassobaculum sp. TaxID=2022740 RepID=UPI0032ED71BF